MATSPKQVMVRRPSPASAPGIPRQNRRCRQPGWSQTAGRSFKPAIPACRLFHPEHARPQDHARTRVFFVELWRAAWAFLAALAFGSPDFSELAAGACKLTEYRGAKKRSPSRRDQRDGKDHRAVPGLSLGTCGPPGPSLRLGAQFRLQAGTATSAVFPLRQGRQEAGPHPRQPENFFL